MANGTQINWTSYINTPFTDYEVFRTNDEGTRMLIGITDSSVTTFTDDSILCPGTYQYSVEATNLWQAGYTAASNHASAEAEGLPYLNQRATVVRSTVIDNSTVLTEWLPPAEGEDWITGYNVLRSTDNNPPTHVAFVPAGIHAWVDTDASVENETYTYSLEVTNVCATIAPPNSFGHNIVLQGSSDGLEHQLEWAPYTGWDSGVQEYKVERFQNGMWELIQIVDGDTHSLTIDPIE